MVKILHRNVFRKFFGMAVILLASAASLSAQSFSDRMSDKTGRKVRFGFKLDPGASFLNPQEGGVTRNSGRFYFSYGVLADWFIDDEERYALASGVQVTHFGSVMQYESGKGLGAFSSASTEYDLRLQYIEIPVTLKLKTATAKGFDFYGQFGGFVGAPIRARANVISNMQKFEKQSVLREIQPFAAGMIIGAGLEYPLTETLTGVVGINYQNNFVDITRNGKWNDGRVTANSFILRLGFIFNPHSSVPLPDKKGTDEHFLAQQNYHIGNFEANTARIIEAIHAAEARGPTWSCFPNYAYAAIPAGFPGVRRLHRPQLCRDR